jgi:hypothetical protein
MLELGENSFQVFGFKGVIGKVFWNQRVAAFFLASLVFSLLLTEKSSRQNLGRDRWPRPDCFLRIVRSLGLRFLTFSYFTFAQNEKRRGDGHHGAFVMNRRLVAW